MTVHDLFSRCTDKSITAHIYDNSWMIFEGYISSLYTEQPDDAFLSTEEGRNRIKNAEVVTWELCRDGRADFILHTTRN